MANPLSILTSLTASRGINVSVGDLIVSNGTASANALVFSASQASQYFVQGQPIIQEGYNSVEPTIKAVLQYTENFLNYGSYAFLRTQATASVYDGFNGEFIFLLNGGANQAPWFSQEDNIITAQALKDLYNLETSDECLRRLSYVSFDVATLESGSNFWTNDLVSVKLQATSSDNSTNWYPKVVVTAPALLSDVEGTSKIRFLATMEDFQAIYGAYGGGGNGGGGPQIYSVYVNFSFDPSELTGSFNFYYDSEGGEDNLSWSALTGISSNFIYGYTEGGAYTGSFELPQTNLGYYTISSSVGSATDNFDGNNTNWTWTFNTASTQFASSGGGGEEIPVNISVQFNFVSGGYYLNDNSFAIRVFDTGSNELIPYWTFADFEASASGVGIPYDSNIPFSGLTQNDNFTGSITLSVPSPASGSIIEFSSSLGKINSQYNTLQFVLENDTSPYIVNVVTTDSSDEIYISHQGAGTDETPIEQAQSIFLLESSNETSSSIYAGQYGQNEWFVAYSGALIQPLTELNWFNTYSLEGALNVDVPTLGSALDIQQYNSDGVLIGLDRLEYSGSFATFNSQTAYLRVKPTGSYNGNLISAIDWRLNDGITTFSFNELNNTVYFTIDPMEQTASLGFNIEPQRGGSTGSWSDLTGAYGAVYGESGTAVTGSLIAALYNQQVRITHDVNADPVVWNDEFATINNPSASMLWEFYSTGSILTFPYTF